MKILLQSNAPWAHTGYGVPSKSLIHRLKDAGYDITVFAFYGLHGGSLQMGDILVIPPGKDPWGNDIIEAHVNTVKPDLVITNMDAWVLGDSYARLKAFWAPWHPIDHDEVPIEVKQKLLKADMPLPYTKAGEEAEHRVGLTKAKHIHIGIESDEFYVNKEERQKMRAHLGVPDDGFLIGMVANNRGYPFRKGFDIAFDAFKRLRQKHPKTYFYCHSEIGPGPDQPPLGNVLYALGMRPEDIIWPLTYDYAMGYSNSLMRSLYNAFDVLVAPSMGEGFHLPSVEAAACGLPVVVSNWTSLPEVTCPEARYLIRAVTDHITVQGARWFVADVKSTLRGLEWARENKGNQVMARRAREFAVDNFDWNHLFATRWIPILREIEEQIADGRPGTNREDQDTVRVEQEVGAGTAS